jgi:hypothetical protein
MSLFLLGDIMYANQDQLMDDYLRLCEKPENKEKENSAQTLMSAMNVVLMKIWADKRRLAKMG